MRIAAALLAGGIGLLTAPLAAQTPGRAATDSARLQGTWTMISGSANGYQLPPDYVKGMRRVETGDEVTITMGGQLFFKATIELHPTVPLKEIDYRMTGGPTTGALQLGIYSISGDTVRFCFGSPNALRPTEFTSVAGDGRTMSTWARAKP